MLSSRLKEQWFNFAASKVKALVYDSNPTPDMIENYGVGVILMKSLGQVFRVIAIENEAESGL